MNEEQQLLWEDYCALEQNACEHGAWPNQRCGDCDDEERSGLWYQSYGYQV